MSALLEQPPIELEQPTIEKDPSPGTREPIPHEAIELRAYFRYTNRGFLDGFALEDWLEAEQELRQEAETGETPS